jgi:hypothetical protein
MADDKTTRKEANGTCQAAARVLPDPHICSLRVSTGIPNLAHCVVECPVGCKYAVSYGLGYLCSCPQESEADTGLSFNTSGSVA